MFSIGIFFAYLNLNFIGTCIYICVFLVFGRWKSIDFKQFWLSLIYSDILIFFSAEKKFQTLPTLKITRVKRLYFRVTPLSLPMRINNINIQLWRSHKIFYFPSISIFFANKQVETHFHVYGIFLFNFISYLIIM